MTNLGEKAAGVATAALLLAGAALCVHFGDGYFLSDDFAYVADFGRWTTLQLIEEVARRFVSGIDGANAFWRPLTYTSFALNYAFAGAEPRAWLAVNLVLHLANALLVGALVERLGGFEGARRRVAGAFGGIVFFALASNWEVAMWVAARYDAFAAFFTLLAGWWYAKGRSRMALVAAALALMSKEAGSAALVLVGWIAIARAFEDPDAPAADVARDIADRLWPFVLLGGAYVALRIVLFGNPTQVYAAAPPDAIGAAHWRELWRSWWVWSGAVYPASAALRALALALGALLFVLGLFGGRRRVVASLLAVLACLATTLFLLSPHLPQFDPSGIGGRLLYLPGALLAVASGLALGGTLYSSPRAMRATAATIALVLALAHLHWMWRAAREYHALHREMREVASGIAQESLRMSGAPALLYLPDVLGRAQFGRNVRTGLTMPPVQRIPLSDRVRVLVDADIPKMKGAQPQDPSAYFCWTAGHHRFNSMDVGAGDPSNLASRIEAGYEHAGCRAVPPLK